MMDSEELVKQLLENTRSHAAYFAIGEKNRIEKEINEILNFQEAYDSCLSFRNLIGSPDDIECISQGGRSFELSDPPDLHIAFKDGKKVGVEITNFVDRASIHLSEIGDHDPKDWSKGDFLNLLKDLIAKKDKEWEGDFDHSVLLMFCDEPYLSRGICEGFLNQVELNSMFLDDVFLFFSPEPLKPTGEGIQIPISKGIE